MPQLALYAADTLIIAAGMAWAYLAGRHSITIGRHGWPSGTTHSLLMATPFFGMAAEAIFVLLAARGRLRATMLLATLSLACALGLGALEAH